VRPRIFDKGKPAKYKTTKFRVSSGNVKSLLITAWFALLKHISLDDNRRKSAIKLSCRRACPVSMLVSFDAGLSEYEAVTQP
jgi:hypothetical protein